jgi:hypothetical protein
MTVAHSIEKAFRPETSPGYFAKHQQLERGAWIDVQMKATTLAPPIFRDRLLSAMLILVDGAAI